jgi:hypothetical protein
VVQLAAECWRMTLVDAEFIVVLSRMILSIVLIASAAVIITCFACIGSHLIGKLNWRQEPDEPQPRRRPF